MHFRSVEALQKLYRKLKAIDESLDDKGDLNTLRVVWSEVVENLDRGEHPSMAVDFRL
jgi:hypothetical protein